LQCTPSILENDKITLNWWVFSDRPTPPWAAFLNL